MRRRRFIGLMGVAALGVARPAIAQTKTDLPLVGVLVPRTQEPANDALAALRTGLQEAGFVEGTNYSFAMRFANGDLDRLPSLAMELGALTPRVIVASPVPHAPYAPSTSRPSLVTQRRGVVEQGDE